MKPKSDNLFHFTKSLAVLKLILKNGIKPRYCLEDVEWHGGDDKHLAFPIACFCDIPLSRISDHTDFYGYYGVGLTKAWGQKNGLNPVVYSPADGQIQKLASSLLNDTSPNSTDHAYKLWSLFKPTIGKMVIAGQVVEKEFYQESEWRYVPPGINVIGQDKFDEEKEKKNQDIENHSLQFSPSDIRYIFVKDDSDIPELVDFITGELGMHPLNDLKILQSRIVSLTTLRADL